jgi:hypothetical protein
MVSPAVGMLNSAGRVPGSPIQEMKAAGDHMKSGKRAPLSSSPAEATLNSDARVPGSLILFKSTDSVVISEVGLSV